MSQTPLPANGDTSWRDWATDIHNGQNIADQVTAGTGVASDALKAAFGPLQQVAATVTASGALVANRHNPVDASGGAKTMTLPTGQAHGTQISVEKTDSSTNAVAVTGNIRGVGSSTINLVWQYEDLVFRADSSGSWWPISGHKTKTALDAAFASYVGSILRADLQRKREQFLRDNAIAPTVYIDSVNGNDTTGDGTTPAKAYATLGKLTSVGVVAGARIGLARGSTFTLGGAFTFPSLTGTPSATNRTVICAYGTGAAPVITGNIFNITAAGTAGSYIDIQDIKFTNCSTGYALFVFNATTQTDVRIKRCELGPHAGTGGIIMGVVGGLVEDCYFHDVWTNVEYPSGNGYALFLTTGTDNTVVRFNTVYNCYKGLAAGNTHRDALLYRNQVIKCRVNGIDMGGGGVVAHPPKILNNFVWHNPTTANGHGIDTQSSSVGPYWRNNIVVSDYSGTSGNVELYCIDSTSYSSTDVDYNLGYLYPGSTCDYGKLGATNYSTLSAFQTALNGTSFAGKEAHSIQADPLIASLVWPNGAYVPLPTSPALNAGVAVAPVSDAYLGTAPDLGAYEVG